MGVLSSQESKQSRA